ncbi:cupin domain-containing protein [Amycolatopsis sp. NPDC006131]|uniref:cupin domain-containing protein n=1 Tax=Amycolatopsis sp. NPDC006131 TaxID=3156731 RepID=UPI0033A74799
MANRVIVHAEENGPVSGWDDPLHGTITWRTLFSGDTTGTTGLTAGAAEVPPGGLLRRHHHEPAEVYFVVHGHGTILTEEGEHPVGPGSSVFIPGGVPHGIRNTGPVPLRFCYVLAADSFGDVEYHFD